MHTILSKLMPIVEEALTNKEMEVLHLARQNMTNQEIADSLFVAESTIIKHRENIYKKVGVKGKQEVRKFLRQVGRELEDNLPLFVKNT
jgi:DNA-binding CsgD family transcriptional regulator